MNVQILDDDAQPVTNQQGELCCVTRFGQCLSVSGVMMRTRADIKMPIFPFMTISGGMVTGQP